MKRRPELVDKHVYGGFNSYNINMIQEYHRYLVKSFKYKAGLKKINVGEVQLSLFKYIMFTWDW